MDPRVFFRKDSANAPSTVSSSPPPGASPADLALDASNCSYSSLWSTQCVNGSCDSTQRRFRQCEGRPREELVTRPDGSERWAKADEATTADDPLRLSIDAALPDPFVSLFDDIRAQSQLTGQSFRDAFGPVTSRWPQPPSGQEGESREESSGKEEEGKEGLDSDELLRGSVLDGLMGALHGLSRDAVDSFFGRTRPPSRADTADRSSTRSAATSTPTTAASSPTATLTATPRPCALCCCRRGRDEGDFDDEQ